MIHKAHRNRLKKVLGNHYTDKVFEILEEKKIYKKQGTPYGKSMIRNVFNGINENKRIENAILELYSRNLEKSKKREELIKELLKL